MEYGMRVRLAAPFAEAVKQVRSALRDRGFGVLTEIDIRSTLREKIGEEMEDFVILGACNPSLAFQALETDRQIGLLLPCNVVVRAEGDETVVEALNPDVMVSVTGRAELKPVADEATRRLALALKSLGS